MIKSQTFAKKYLQKGTKIVLSGKLENNSYTDRDGKYHPVIEIVADDIEFAESKAS